MGAAESKAGTARRKRSTSRSNWFGGDTRKNRSESSGAAICFESGEKWRRSRKSFKKVKAETVVTFLRRKSIPLRSIRKEVDTECGTCAVLSDTLCVSFGCRRYSRRQP